MRAMLIQTGWKQMRLHLTHTKRVGWVVRLVSLFLVVTVLALLSGIPQHLYRMAYDILAFPVAVMGETIRSMAHPHTHVVSWTEWMGRGLALIDHRYDLLQTKAYAGMQGVIFGEVVIVIALPVLVGWRVTWFLVTRLGRVTPGAPHGSARWMQETELRALSYRTGGLLLGQSGRHTVGLDRTLQTMNIMLIGPPGSGKSSAVIIANLLRESGRRSLVITDLKNELLQTCYDHVARSHDVWVVNFLSPTTSLGYNPLAYCVDELSTALFANAWISNTGRSEKDPFWDNATRELLVAGIAHLRALYRGGVPPLAELDAFLCGLAPDRVIGALETSPSPLARKRARSFLASLKKNDKLLGAVFSEITPRLLILADQRVQATTSVSEVDFRRMVDPSGPPVALFLALDRTLQDELKPLVAAFFLDLFRTLSTVADETPGGTLSRDVFVYGDEFGNLGAIPKMPIWISTLRSAGVGMLVALQTTAQGKATYGKEGFATITASCATKLGLSNMGDDDAKWFSEMAGQATVVATSASQQRERFHLVTKGGSRSEQETSRSLMTVDEVRRLPSTEMLAIIGERPPVRLMQRRWYADPQVRDRGTTPDPTQPYGARGPRRTVPLTAIKPVDDEPIDRDDEEIDRDDDLPSQNIPSIPHNGATMAGQTSLTAQAAVPSPRSQEGDNEPESSADLLADLLRE